MTFNNGAWNRMTILLAGCVAMCAVGCQSLPRSGLDPYGERLFESNPLDCNLFRSRTGTTTAAATSQTPTPISATPVPQPTPVAATVAETPSGSLPGGFGAAQRTNAAVPVYGTTATPTDPAARGINTALIASPDAGPTPVFESTGGYALPIEPVEGPALIMTPREQIAPVGSEVVLISSYLGNKDRLITNEKIEWTLEGAGSIQKFDPGSRCDPLRFDYARARKITDRYAVTKTSQVYRTLDRGTPDTHDDIHLLRGQTWISVNSMREGTTHVTAFAPSMKDWSKRSDVGIIHWVDAQWVLPRLPIAPVGDSRVLTTSVLRRTNGQPRRGWIVRYEILSGPPAGFGPSGAQIEEIETDMSGQASIILRQQENQTGTNSIAVRIIRPDGVDGSDRRVTVGSETIRQTWAGSAGVRIRAEGPATASVGRDIPYVLTAVNDTGAMAQGTVAVTMPPTVSYIRSDPPARQDGATLQWDVTVPPNNSTTIQLILRQGTPGAWILDAKFHPLGAASPPAISGTSVPAPGGSGSLGALPDPASTIPVLPGESTAPPPASVFPGGESIPTPTSSGAEVFATGWTLSINAITDPEANPVFQLGKPCLVSFKARNNGTASATNVVLRLNLPSEYEDRSSAGLSAVRSNGTLDRRTFMVNMSVPSVKPKEEVELLLQLPTITAQGYRFEGRVLVNDREAATESKHILPPR